jgi:hypothetical protein
VIGDDDLAMLLASLRPWIRPGEYVVVTRPGWEPVGAAATIVESEGVTHVVERGAADLLGWSYDYVAGWITLLVHSSLGAVGLTAAVSRALAEAGISCNMLAGFHHDHLLVPVDRVHEAHQILERLSSDSSRRRS